MCSLTDDAESFVAITTVLSNVLTERWRYKFCRSFYSSLKCAHKVMTLQVLLQLLQLFFEMYTRNDDAVSFAAVIAVLWNVHMKWWRYKFWRGYYSYLKCAHGMMMLNVLSRLLQFIEMCTWDDDATHFVSVTQFFEMCTRNNNKILSRLLVHWNVHMGWRRYTICLGNKVLRNVHTDQ